MRIKLFDRILLAVFMLLIIAASVTVLACAWGAIPLENTRYTVDLAITTLWGRIWASLAALLTLVVGIKLLLIHEPAARSPRAALVKNGELGTVSITIPALDTLVQKSVHSVPGVREAFSQISVLPQGIGIFLRVSFMPDVVIPETSDKIQTAVKEFVQNHAGVSVVEVRVSVDSTSGVGTSKGRLE